MPLPEKALITRIAGQARSRGFTSRGTNTQKRPAGSRVAALLRGIGDDCALLRLPGRQDALITTDFSLEGVHFRREWHPAESVGHRCLARGLSDIAAMGGEPVAAFLSLALPARLPQAWVNAFLRGFLALADQFSVPLAGGDTALSPAGVLADIIVLGSVPRGKAVLRSGARPGDSLYVTGRLGGSALVISQLLAGSRKRFSPRRFPAHFFPVPRLRVGRFLSQRSLASAMIDISDGLSTDLRHICQESRVGARLWAEHIPVAEGAELRHALHGGEDYELLFASKTRIPTRTAGIPVTRIGEVTRGRDIVLINRGREQKLPAAGWEHFGPHRVLT